MSPVATRPTASLEAEAVKEAIAAIGMVLFLDTQRREASQGRQYDRRLNDLVLTAERQFLWDALQRLRQHDRTVRAVLLSPQQSKCMERLDALRGSVCAGDDFAALVLVDLKQELRERTRLPQIADTQPTKAA